MAAQAGNSDGFGAPTNRQPLASLPFSPQAGMIGVSSFSFFVERGRRKIQPGLEQFRLLKVR